MSIDSTDVSKSIVDNNNSPDLHEDKVFQWKRDSSNPVEKHSDDDSTDSDYEVKHISSGFFSNDNFENISLEYNMPDSVVSTELNSKDVQMFKLAKIDQSKKHENKKVLLDKFSKTFPLKKNNESIFISRGTRDESLNNVNNNTIQIDFNNINSLPKELTKEIQKEIHNETSTIRIFNGSIFSSKNINQTNRQIDFNTTNIKTNIEARIGRKKTIRKSISYIQQESNDSAIKNFVVSNQSKKIAWRDKVKCESSETNTQIYTVVSFPLEIHFDHCTNIYELHKKIVNALLYKNTIDIENYKIKLSILNRERETFQTVSQKIITINNIKKYERCISDNESHKNLYMFTEETKNILSEYSKLEPVDFSVDFDKPIQKFVEITGMRKKLLTEYLTITKRYVRINVISKTKRFNMCINCGCDSFVQMGNGNVMCENCSMEIVKFALSKSAQDYSLQAKNRSNYQDLENFIKALSKYQGKQPPKDTEQLCKALNQFFQRYDMPDGEIIRKMPLNSDGVTRGNTSRDKMKKALSETGYSHLYDEMNLICHLYWGWKLPDVSHLEKKILEYYETSQKYFLMIKTNKRKSCLNSQYRLYRLLNLCGHKCNLKDFKLLKTPEIWHNHETMWEKICELAGWTFVPIM